MFRALISLAMLSSWFRLAIAQQSQPTPPVKVNVLNVCSPSRDEQTEMAAALAGVPTRPVFAPDFEVARGRSSLSDKTQMLQSGEGGATSSEPIVAAWVRIRREFAPQTTFSNVQYSFSSDRNSMVETLVMHVRDPKDLIQLSIEDRASSVTSPASMLATSTPAERIRLERLGKSSVVLARCQGSQDSPPPDQSAYEPLFERASAILGRYRDLLGARQTVPQELAKVVISGGVKAKAKAKSAGKRSESENK